MENIEVVELSWNGCEPFLGLRHGLFYVIQSSQLVNRGQQKSEDSLEKLIGICELEISRPSTSIQIRNWYSNRSLRYWCTLTFEPRLLVHSNRISFVYLKEMIEIPPTKQTHLDGNERAVNTLLTHNPLPHNSPSTFHSPPPSLDNVPKRKLQRENARCSAQSVPVQMRTVEKCLVVQWKCRSAYYDKWRAFRTSSQWDR